MRTLFAAFCFFAGTTLTNAQDLPDDLKHVPGNAIGFVHIRTAEMWKSPLFKMYRDVLPKAGADAVKMLEERITPSLATIDRVTVVVLLAGANPDRPKFGFFVHTSVPLDQKSLVANLEKVGLDGGRSFFRTPKGEAIQIFGANTILLGEGDVPELIAKGGLPPEPFRKGLAAAAGSKKMIVAAANTTLVPADALEQVPPPIRPFARANTVVASLDWGEEIVAAVELGFADADHATAADRALADFRQMGKDFLKQAKNEVQAKLPNARVTVPLYDIDKVAEIVGPVFALAALARADELLASIPVKRDNNNLTVTLRVPEELKAYGAGAPVMVALLLPAVQKVREAAARAQQTNNLKQLALAMHVHYDARKSFPSPAICDAARKPLLSWRVAILPYIEQEELYKKFKLDEPWDSVHNKKLLPLMPDVYRLPNSKSPKDSMTHYRVFVGPGALFSDYAEKVSMKKITDGTSNTLMIVTANESVPWTKPEELPFNPNGPLPKFTTGLVGSPAARCDGSVLLISPNIREATLRALITRNGGEVVDIDQ